MNLLLNASQAISPGGHIRLERGSKSNRAVVVVADDGPGIPPEIIDRIFDPFFTTKPVGEGTDLGLGIAYQIVRSHGCHPRRLDARTRRPLPRESCLSADGV